MAILVIVGLAGACAAQSEQQNNAIVSLKSQLLQILLNKDTAGFLSLIGSSGITFGVGGDQQFKNQVAEQFDQKRDAYCFLFDTKCLTKETPHKRLALRPCSVHELVSRRNGWSMDYQAGPPDAASQVALVLKPTNDMCSNGGDPIPFIFTEFPDGWKLVAVPYE